jgi:hypothetical protein
MRAMLSDLKAFERRVYSQYGEDGVIERIFSCIGETNRFFVEFGAGDGVSLSNTAHLRLDRGWTGLLMDGNPKHESRLIVHTRVDAENIEALLEKHGVPPAFDLISIDIDGNDYWVWDAIRRFTPRVVVIEYNIFFGLHQSKTMAYRADHVWDKSTYHGASLAALHKLGRSKGYSLVWTESYSPNAFFVLDSELPPEFVDRPIEQVAHWTGYDEPGDSRHRHWVDV